MLMPAKPHYMPLYWNDLLGDNLVRAMNTAEFGAYMFLLGAAWQEEPPATLPNNDQVLANLTRLAPPAWQEIKLAVLAPFELQKDGRLIQKRLLKVYKEVVSQMRFNKKRARDAANKRWGKQNPKTDPEAPPAQPPAQSIFATCSLQEMVAYAESLCIPRACAEWVFDSFEANGWRWGVNPINNWKGAFRVKAKDWRAADHLNKPKDHRSQKSAGEFPEPELKAKILK